MDSYPFPTPSGKPNTGGDAAIDVDLDLDLDPALDSELDPELFSIEAPSTGPRALSAQEPDRSHRNDPHNRSDSIPELYIDAYSSAVQAVQEDTNGDHHTARLLYCEVCEIFNKLLKLIPLGTERDLVNRKLDQYSKRAEFIWESRSDSISTLKDIRELPDHERLAQEAQFAYEQGVAECDKQHEQGALDFFTDSADLFWQAWKAAPEGEAKEALKQRLGEVMSKAEDLKGISAKTVPLTKTKPGAAPVIAGPSTLTPQELQVLRTTMLINNKKYHPWSDSDVKDILREKGPFTDPDGMLALSKKQTAKFGSWRRVSQIMENPKMICLISSTSIVQDIVTDCSFVASLCVSASYERRWKKQLIRACIYPKNKFGEPCYNPHGKYLVKLTFNGIARRVVVDDYLPVSKSGTLMCTFSTNKNELWPSIVEKAYMKLMGGYDFPGSNSGIDLYALTGWIPEHIFINEANFDKEKQWKRMMSGMRNGVALVTIATGQMSDEVADQMGLVPTHAYAVLELKEVQGLRLLQVKNPWSHKRWKGPFSHLDAEHWTEELKNELNYDQFAALKNDDGIFWIDYDSVCSNFDTIHINWNLETLTYRAVIHAPWPWNHGPKQDKYTLGYNPQFSLFTNVKGTRPCFIWLLLSKHVTVTEENRDYITLHVFDVKKQPGYTSLLLSPPPVTPGSATSSPSISTTPLPKTPGSLKSQKSSASLLQVSDPGRIGTRIYYEGNTLIKGMYVNSPHILVRFEVPPGQNEYTIVLSQHLKTRDLHFTLRAYAICEFEMREIPNKYPIEKKIDGEWTRETAGGNSYHAGFMNNPQYRLVVPVLPAPQTTTSVLFMMESPKDLASHVQLVNSQGKRISCVWTKDIVAQSGEYRHGFCYCEAPDLRPGQYTLVVSTFEPGQIGKYKITMQSHIDLSLMPIPIEGAGMFKKILRGEWVLGVSAMGWHHHQSIGYARNPHFLVTITEMTTFMVRLQTPEMTNPMPKINVTIFERLDEGVLGREVSSSGPYTSVPQGVATEATTLLPNQYGYLIVVSTLYPGVAGKFMLYAYSDRTLDIEPGGGAAAATASVGGDGSSGGGYGGDGGPSSIRSLSISSAGSTSPTLSPPESTYAGGYPRPSSRFRRHLRNGSTTGTTGTGSSSTSHPGYG
ncbi:calpain 7 [Lunasporangiospora selenospora]|uniref:Calpain 7 n=1 Tax=Lunasporangiospora selenospora TaxID=979761 RepID=A0A9P6G2X6_9FUNG|nr:calpain 7 [Lunasporangiospora selenospora]